MIEIHAEIAVTFVEIRHNTVNVLYCHMTSDTLTVSTGQKVARAQRLGTMRTSGHSISVHLHVRVTEINGGATRDIRTRLGLNEWRTC
jgi:murein DD-endopeptidase MepM/ murein hydrolase activator NlpD